MFNGIIEFSIEGVRHLVSIWMFSNIHIIIVMCIEKKKLYTRLHSFILRQTSLEQSTLLNRS